MLLILLIPYSIFAQIKIQGKVTDESGLLLSMANVTLLSEKDSLLILGTVTDSAGFYKLNLLKPEKNKFILKCSILGCESEFFNLSLPDSSIYTKNIQLRNSAVQLKNVTITASNNFFSLSKEGVLVDVEHSILQNETTPISLLSKIPNIIVQGNNVEILGRGTPTYYINDKKAQNFSEVERLLVKDIQSVTLINSPGAKYDSNGKPVIVIKVKRIRDGLMIQTNLNATQAHRFNHGESLNINYKTEKLTLFSSYGFNDSGSRKYDDVLQTITSDTVWNLFTNSVQNNYVRGQSYQIGFDYDIKPHQSFGIKYNGGFSKSHQNKKEELAMNYNDTAYVNISNQSKSSSTNVNHHINLFYSGSWNDKWTLGFYADYVRQTSSQVGEVNEVDSDKGEKSASSVGITNWDIYAMSTSLKYDIGKAGYFNIGGNFSWTNGYGAITNLNVLRDGRTNTNERKQAFYLTYDYSINKFSLNFGIRYESLYSKSQDMFNPINKKENTYRNFFPSATMLYTTKEISQSISYSMSVNRPPFDIMNNNAYYTGRFNYYIGNINLKPATIHDINYIFLYKYLYLNLCYSNIHNKITTVCYADSKKSSVIIGYEDNLKKYHQLAGSLSFRYPIKWWNPSLSINCVKSFFHYPTPEGVQHSVRPYVGISWINYFTLPNNFAISADFRCWLAGDFEMIKTKGTSSFSIRLQKTLLNKRLQLTLDGHDIFNKDRIKSKAYFNNIQVNSYSKNNTRKVSFSIIYRFNYYTKKYKGESAATEEINRLGGEE